MTSLMVIAPVSPSQKGRKAKQQNWFPKIGESESQVV
jgi:hypothetical protein